MNKIIREFAELTDKYAQGLINNIEFAKTIEWSCKQYIKKENLTARRVLTSARIKH